MVATGLVLHRPPPAPNPALTPAAGSSAPGPRELPLPKAPPCTSSWAERVQSRCPLGHRGPAPRPHGVPPDLELLQGTPVSFPSAQSDSCHLHRCDAPSRAAPVSQAEKPGELACCQDVCAEPTGPTEGTAGADASSRLGTHTLFSTAVLKVRPEGLRWVPGALSGKQVNIIFIKY